MIFWRNIVTILYCYTCNLGSSRCGGAFLQDEVADLTSEIISTLILLLLIRIILILILIHHQIPQGKDHHHHNDIQTGFLSDRGTPVYKIPLHKVPLPFRPRHQQSSILRVSLEVGQWSPSTSENSTLIANSSSVPSPSKPSSARCCYYYQGRQILAEKWLTF